MQAEGRARTGAQGMEVDVHRAGKSLQLPEAESGKVHKEQDWRFEIRGRHIV